MRLPLSVTVYKSKWGRFYLSFVHSFAGPVIVLVFDIPKKINFEKRLKTLKKLLQGSTRFIIY